MLPSIWWGLGLTLVLTSIIFLTLSKKQKEIVLGYLPFKYNTKQTSTTTVDPHSSKVATEKKPLGEDTHEDSFPPSRRFALGEIKSSLPEKLGKSIEELVKSPSDSRTSCVPHDKPWDAVKQPAYTATEFSVEEIQALGDFPDYAGLSGVPPPEPYLNFNLDTAKPRPYRPFRWAYHQTMCMKLFSMSVSDKAFFKFLTFTS